MSQQILTHRVAGDLGPPLSFRFDHVDVTDWTITAYFRDPNGREWSTAAVVTQAGDGGDTPAEFNFPFAAGELVEGITTVTVKFDAPAFDAFSIPSDQPFRIKVRSVHG